MIPIRSSGVLLHLSSLPGPYGVGSMGEDAYRFVDFLQAAGQRYWQILPLVPPGGGHSPYQSHSGIAGNPFLIDLDKLRADELLTEEELQSARQDTKDQVDFDFLAENRMALLYTAFSAHAETGRRCHRILPLHKRAGCPITHCSSPCGIISGSRACPMAGPRHCASHRCGHEPLLRAVGRSNSVPLLSTIPLFHPVAGSPVLCQRKRHLHHR